ncbi:hypothetical protein OROGR_009259 [Orobanche gracilis]
MELPTFEGTEALTWITGAEQFFLVHETPLDAKVRLALVAVAGVVQPWAHGHNDYYFANNAENRSSEAFVLFLEANPSFPRCQTLVMTPQPPSPSITRSFTSTPYLQLVSFAEIQEPPLFVPLHLYQDENGPNAAAFLSTTGSGTAAAATTFATVIGKENNILHRTSNFQLLKIVFTRGLGGLSLQGLAAKVEEKVNQIQMKLMSR